MKSLSLHECNEKTHESWRTLLRTSCGCSIKLLNGLAILSAYRQAVIAASQLEWTSSLVPWPCGHPHFHLLYWLSRQGSFIKFVPSAFWPSTTSQYCFAFDSLLVTLATSAVSFTASIWYHQGIKTCKWRVILKKNPKKPPSGQRMFTPCSWAELSSFSRGLAEL